MLLPLYSLQAITTTTILNVADPSINTSMAPLLSTHNQSKHNLTPSVLVSVASPPIFRDGETTLPRKAPTKRLRPQQKIKPHHPSKHRRHQNYVMPALPIHYVMCS
jgi:hypothetical protein